MVERLGAGPASVSELGAPFPVSLTAIGQHLRVLEESGLVRSRKTKSYRWLIPTRTFQEMFGGGRGTTASTTS